MIHLLKFLSVQEPQLRQCPYRERCLNRPCLYEPKVSRCHTYLEHRVNEIELFEQEEAKRRATGGRR